MVKYYDLKDFNRSLKDDWKNDEASTMTYLMKQLDDSGYNINFLMQWAAIYGHLDILNILLKNPLVDPSSDNNFAICYSYLYYDIVCRLLKDPRVDPSASDNLPLYQTSLYGDFDVVNRLLQDPRVIPHRSLIHIVREWSNPRTVEVLKHVILKNHAAKILKLQAVQVARRHIFNWLTLPRTSDGRLGIDLRVGLRHLSGALTPLS